MAKKKLDIGEEVWYIGSVPKGYRDCSWCLQKGDHGLVTKVWGDGEAYDIKWLLDGGSTSGNPREDLIDKECYKFLTNVFWSTISLLRRFFCR